MRVVRGLQLFPQVVIGGFECPPQARVGCTQRQQLMRAKPIPAHHLRDDGVVLAALHDDPHLDVESSATPALHTAVFAPFGTVRGIPAFRKT